MSTTMRIAEVADRSGFSAATLRYYEQLDLLPPPPRSSSGYRAYDESVLDRLAFIARAKLLGCSLEEIGALMPDWDGGRCAPVQDRLRHLVRAKLGDARARMADLGSFTADLQRILDSLGAHTPDGPCDPDCGCVTNPPAAPEPVACTLDAAEMPGRLQEWRELVTHVVGRAAIDGGTRLQLDSDTPLDQLVDLVAAEQACCSFFAFAITVDSRGVALEVRAPAEGQGQGMVDSLFAA
jgi:MerR family transcriptional regulator, copper efflux regulator